MTDPVPSKDQLAEVLLTPEQDARVQALMGECYRKHVDADPYVLRIIVHLLSENDRLRRQVDELSMHAEKWVKRALGGATPEPPADLLAAIRSKAVEALGQWECPDVRECVQEIIDVIDARATQPPGAGPCG